MIPSPFKVPVPVVVAGVMQAAVCGWFLYRSAPSPSSAVFGVLAILFGVGLLTMARMAWRQSITVATARVLTKMSKVPVWAVSAFLDHELANYPPEQVTTMARRLASFVRLRENEWFDAFAAVLETRAILFDDLIRFDQVSRRDITAKMKRTVEAHEAYLELAAKRGHQRELRVTEVMVAQERLFSDLLNCESSTHFGALRGRLADVQQKIAEGPEVAFLQPELLNDLDLILERLDPMSRLPQAEDRAAVLSQALAQVLQTKDRLTQRSEGKSASVLRIGLIVLESMRQIFTEGLEEIQRRASLVLQLQSKAVTTRREAVIVLSLKNVGHGQAENVVVELVPADAKFRSMRRQRAIKNLVRGQEARIEFLIEPLVSDSVRLKFDVSYDDLTATGNQRRFFETVEFREIGGHQAFVPLRPNPYIVGRPLSSEDLFFGRADVFSRLESSLRGAHQDNVIVLMGPHRMGKTSILRRLHQHLGEDYVTVLIDLQGMIGSGEVAFFSDLMAEIRDALEDQGIEVEEPTGEVFENDPGYAFRRVFLKEVRRVIGDRRLLLMFDELEVLEEQIRNGDLQPRILPYFRSLMQHERKISFVFAGTHRLDELTWDYWGVLFNLAIYLEIGHLSEEDLKELLEAPTKKAFAFDPLALDKVWQLTNGHPYFSQLVARQLVEFRNHQQLTWVTVQDVNAVANQVVVKGRLHISYLFDGASQSELALAFAVEELLRSKGLATLEGARRLLANQGVETEDLSAALKQLVRKNILADNGGMVTFRMELLRGWLTLYEDLPSFLGSQAT